MFQAKVKENTPFSAARARPERHGDTRNDLKPIFEVVRPANTRIEQKCAAPLSCAWRNHVFISVKHRFKQKIEAGVDQPYKTLAQVISERGGSRSGVVASMGNDGSARVPVRDQFPG